MNVRLQALGRTAWQYRHACYAFAVAAAYWPGMPDAGMQPRWMLITLAPLMLWKTKATSLTLGHLFGVAAISWAALSLLWTSNIYDGAGLLMQMILLACVFVLGTRIELRPCIIGFGWGIALSGIVAGIQLWRPIAPSIGSGSAGLFVNSDLLGQAAALAIIGSIIYRHYWPLPLLACAMFLAQSRTGYIAFGISVLFWARRQKWSGSRIAVLGGVALAALTIVWITKHPTDSIRLDTLRDTVNGLTWFGHGLGSYQTTFAEQAIYRDTLMHNPVWTHCDPLQLLYELGPGALFIFALFGLALLAQSSAAILLGGIVVESLFSFPFYAPTTAFLAALCLGHLWRDRFVLPDRLDAWAVLLRAQFGLARSQYRFPIWRAGSKGVSL